MFIRILCTWLAHFIYVNSELSIINDDYKFLISEKEKSSFPCLHGKGFFGIHLCFSQNWPYRIILGKLVCLHVDVKFNLSNCSFLEFLKIKRRKFKFVFSFFVCPDWFLPRFWGWKLWIFQVGTPCSFILCCRWGLPIFCWFRGMHWLVSYNVIYAAILHTYVTNQFACGGLY